jgi:hypothetical protein
MRKLLIILCVSIFLFSCDWNSEPERPATVEGYVPVYSSSTIAKQVKSEAPRTTVNGGKMYTVGTILYQVERDSGIHIIDYANPQSPQKIGFIKSFLCKEVAAKNGFIYTNNLSDLVVLDVSNPSNVQVVSRVENVFPDLSLQYPPKPNNFSTVYFECHDESKGLIVAWKKQIINNPKCWR